REGDLAELAHLASSASWWQAPPIDKVGAYAVKIATDEQMRRVAVAACELALQRQAAGYPGRVTLGAKYSIQPRTDGRLRTIVKEAASQHASLTYQGFLFTVLAC